jgi:RepB DNA-primase from phage plasmid
MMPVQKSLEQERREAEKQLAYLKAQLARNVAGEQTFTQDPNVPDSRTGLMYGVNDWERERQLIAKLETQDRVARQLDAMGVSIYTVGVLTIGPEGKHMERFTWDRDRLLQSLPWLKAKNASGANINIGPFGEHGLSLIDDLKREGIQKMKDAGFHPALVVETSPHNFQAWVNHGQVLEQSVRGAASKRLAQMFDGDPSAAAHNHLGKLSGFTNRKEIHRSAEGKYPWVHLVEANGQPYQRAKEFIVGIEEELREGKVEEQRRTRSYVPGSTLPGLTGALKTIDDFRRDPRYGSDQHSVDFAYAMYARARGVDRGEVAAAIATRDLSHKAKNYIEYTITRAEQKIGVGQDLGASL